MVLGVNFFGYLIKVKRLNELEKSPRYNGRQNVNTKNIENSSGKKKMSGFESWYQGNYEKYRRVTDNYKELPRMSIQIQIINHP